jgi:hypothetical protein
MLIRCPWCGNEADYLGEWQDDGEFRGPFIQHMDLNGGDCICPDCNGEFTIKLTYTIDHYFTDGWDYTPDQLYQFYLKQPFESEEPATSNFEDEIANKYGLPAPENKEQSLADKYGLSFSRKKRSGFIKRRHARC